MGIYKDSLISMKNRMEKEIEDINNKIRLSDNILIENELKDLNLDDKIVLFVDKPSFYYNFTKEIVDEGIFINNTRLLDDKIKNIIVGIAQLSDENTLVDFFNSIDTDYKRVAFYIVDNSIYHSGRKIRVALF